MGVSGSGKSTLGAGLAVRLGWPFIEGDALHPRANIEKMGAGHPLTEADRLPWLESIAEVISVELSAGRSCVVACSALKRAYRDLVRSRCPGTRFVYLAASRATLQARLSSRHSHFMPATLLESQIADLEPPAGDEHPIRVDSAGPPGQLVEEILVGLGLRPRPAP
jgi:gluconokinase